MAAAAAMTSALFIIYPFDFKIMSYNRNVAVQQLYQPGAYKPTVVLETPR